MEDFDHDLAISATPQKKRKLPIMIVFDDLLSEYIYMNKNI